MPDKLRSAPLSFVRQEAYWLLALLCFVIYFCHRLYASGLVLNGDAEVNTYFWLHPRLLEAGFDSHRRDYFPILAPLGVYDPWRNLFLYIQQNIFALTGVRWALITQMLCSVSMALGLAFTTFFLFRKLGRSSAAATLGAVIVSFTGFHIIGIREFDNFYIQSFLCVPPSIFFTAQLCNKNAKHWYSFLALVFFITLSLLTGTNVPFFYFAPFLFFIPILAGILQKSFSKTAIALLWLSASFAVGLCLTLPVWLEGIQNLPLQTRNAYVFAGGFSWHDFFYTLLLRDWWNWDTHFHERDIFIGAPVLALMLAGIAQWLSQNSQNLSKKTIMFAVEAMLLLCLIWALAVLLLQNLPHWLQTLISRIYSFQSIRYPERFGMLLLLPCAYFAAYALDGPKTKLVPILVILLSTISAALLFFLDSGSPLFAQAEIGTEAMLTLAALLFVTLLFSFNWTETKWNKQNAIAAIIAIFLSYAWAHLPDTAYARWFFDGQVNQLKEKYFGAPDVFVRLGLKPQYAPTFRLAEARLFSVPIHLSGIPTGQGRILDIADPQSMYSRAHGRASGHEFAFDWIDDPAANQYLARLYHAQTEAILDLANVGWKLEYISSKSEPDYAHLEYRSPSKLEANVVKRILPPLPKYFLVANAVFSASDQTLFEKVISAQRADFKKTVWLFGNESNTGAIETSAERELTISDSNESGDIEITVADGVPGYLFLSFPYHNFWKATVNNLPAVIYRANYAFMAVKVGSDRSQVSLHFDRSFFLNFRTISWIALAILFLFLLVLQSRNKVSFLL